MPNFDKTGPNSAGPKTGRQMGDCQEAELRNVGPRGLRGAGHRMAGQGLNRPTIWPPEPIKN